jgi:hypothetical protein
LCISAGAASLDNAYNYNPIPPGSVGKNYHAELCIPISLSKNVSVFELVDSFKKTCSLVLVWLLISKFDIKVQFDSGGPRSQGTNKLLQNPKCNWRPLFITHEQQSSSGLTTTYKEIIPKCNRRPLFRMHQQTNC